MKILISKIFVFIFVVLSAFCKIQNKQIQHKNNRKLYQSPYLNSFEDYSAKKIGEQEQNDTQPYLGAAPVGSNPTNMSSVIPTDFSAGSTLPGSQMFPMDLINGAQHTLTTSLYNPLGGNPILNAGNTSLAMNPNAINSMSFATQQFAPPFIKVQEQCSSVLKQAVKIAKTVMESQFEQMANFITKYLSQSRFAAEMNELQLTRQLRQDIYKRMFDYANLDVKNIIFGPSGGQSDISQDALVQSIKKLAGQDVTFEKPKVDQFVNKI